MTIKPYGGRLINLKISDEEKKEIISKTDYFKAIYLNSSQQADLDLLATGAYSPLVNFMDYDTYNLVLNEMVLPNGLPWTIPVNLTIDENLSNFINVDEEILLKDKNDQPLALFKIEEKYKINKSEEARLVYGTEDLKHPGVKFLYNSGDISLAGKIKYLGASSAKQSINDNKPKQLRRVINSNGWKTVAAFQTRNPIHCGHEYLHKCILETVDGLLIHPLVGDVFSDEIPTDIRIGTYKIILEKYYPKNKYFLSLFPAYMRYAGPREAVFHAIVRRNYGCTHFIVGRDHAGISGYYNNYESQKIFEKIDLSKLGIIPVFFEEAFYCNICERVVTEKICTHKKENRFFITGTKLRGYLKKGLLPPPGIMRPEVAEVLINYYKKNSFSYT